MKNKTKNKTKNQDDGKFSKVSGISKNKKDRSVI